MRNTSESEKKTHFERGFGFFRLRVSEFRHGQRRRRRHDGSADEMRGTGAEGNVGAHHSPGHSGETRRHHRMKLCV